MKCSGSVIRTLHNGGTLDELSDIRFSSIHKLNEKELEHVRAFCIPPAEPLPVSAPFEEFSSLSSTIYTSAIWKTNEKTRHDQWNVTRTPITNFYWLLQKKVKVKSRIEMGIEPKIFVRKGLRLGLNRNRLSLRLGLGLGLSLRLNSLKHRGEELIEGICNIVGATNRLLFGVNHCLWNVRTL